MATQEGMMKQNEADEVAREAQDEMDGSRCRVELSPEALHKAARDEGDWGFIKFQSGPVSTAGHNGATIEQVLDVLMDRLVGFQQGPFACIENAQAVAHMQAAMNALIDRTVKRQAQGVEGKNEPHQS